MPISSDAHPSRMSHCRHGHLMPTIFHPSSISPFRDAYLTVMPTHQACRISITSISQSCLTAQQPCRASVVPITQSCPPIKYVAFLPCPSHLASHRYDCPSSMSHFHHTHLTLMSACQACRICVMPNWQSCLPIKHVAFSSWLWHGNNHPPIKHVAFLPCSSHRYDCPSSMSHFCHAHLTE